jgi:hypothetical protein
MKREILAVAVALWVCGGPISVARADDAASLLAQGKLDADMGDRQAAAKALMAVADDAAAPAALRWEALVRLGLVRRDAGDAKGATQAFERVWNEYGREKEALRLLVQAVYGALPGEERWDAIWQQVVVEFDRSDAKKPIVRVEWPGVSSQARTYTGTATSFDFTESDLLDVFRQFADISGLNVVVHPGIHGKATIKTPDMPWDEALDRVLAPNGYAANRVGNLVEIGLPARLGTRRHFEGKPIDVAFKDVDLIESLRRVAANGGRTVSVQAGVRGKTFIWLKQVPWDQAFDILVRLNGLAWKQDGAKLRVGLPTELK